LQLRRNYTVSFNDNEGGKKGIGTEMSEYIMERNLEE